MNVEDSIVPHTCEALRPDLLLFPARVIQYGEGVVPLVPCALRGVVSFDELSMALEMYPSIQHFASRSTPTGPCFDRKPTGEDFEVDEESFLEILDSRLLCDRSVFTLSSFSRPELSALIGMIEWSPALQNFFNRKVHRQGTVTLRDIGVSMFGELMADTRGDIAVLVELSATLECAVAACRAHTGDPISVCDVSGAEPLSFDDCWLALSPESDGKREMWVDHIRAIDPRFRWSLGGYRSLESMVSQSVHDNDWLALERLSELGTLISLRLEQTVEQESLSFFFALFDSAVERVEYRWRSLLLMRLGIAGHEQQTLDAVGVIAGVTRERVRQVQVKVARSFGEHSRLWMPRLDRAIETAESMAPILWDDLKPTLVREGLVEESTTLNAFKSLAQFAGREVSWTEGGLVGTKLDDVFVRAVAKAGRKVSDANGVGSLDLVMQSLALHFQAYSESDVRTCLLLSPEVH